MNLIGKKNLTPLKLAAIYKIDQAAELARQTVATPGGIQAQVYLHKALEAQDFLGKHPSKPDAAVDPSAWPLLEAEVGVTGATLWDVATAVAGAVQRSKAFYAKIERLRLAGKAAVRAAVGGDQISSATNITWPTS